jgi:hypothetical protein
MLNISIAEVPSVILEELKLFQPRALHFSALGGMTSVMCVHYAM